MDDIITEWAIMILDGIIYVLAMSALIALFASVVIGPRYVNKKVNQKHSVYELTQEEETVTEMDGIPLAGVIYDIKEAPAEVVIKVGGYTVTDADKTAIKEYGDASNVVSHLRGHIKSKYKKTYVMDHDGNITTVEYQIQL